ncbi:MAG TPA: caspase family protein, partial [Candidatus Limnocylindria bacterium]|nr:caspase family protein [Candidatus Limnocylindria bacterium]
VPTATPTQPPASATVTYRALLVGNSNYAGSVSDLAAGPDLSAMSGLLSKLNMSGKTYKITTRADLSASGITSAISSAFSGADDDDISLFYYSGHGVTDTGTYAGALVGVDISYLTTAQLASALSKVPGTVIVILDSCGSGAVIQSKNATGAATAQEAVSQNPAAFNSAVLSAFSGFTAKSAEMATGSKFKVITACSIATSTWQNANGGFFTQGIARAGALNGSFMNADNDKNGTVTQSEAYSYARSYSKSVNDSSGVIPEWDMQVQSYPSGSAFPFFQR